MSKARDLANQVSNLITISSGGSNFEQDIIYNSASPVSASVGTLWVDSSGANPMMKVWDGSSWDSLGSTPTPLISDINPDNVLGASGSAIYINGQNFQSGAIVSFINNNNIEINSSSVVFIDTSLIVALTPNLSASAAPYGLKITNPDNLYYSLRNKISVGSAPTWNTVSGSLGTIYDIQRGTKTFTVSASDPEGTSVTYSLDSGNLPTGMTLTSGGAVNGTPNAVTNDTTYSFTVKATDGVNNSFRNFSILVKSPIITTYSTVGSFLWTSPSDLNAVRVLVVAGGGGGGTWVASGGGAGGLIHNTNYSILPSTQYSLAVGDGGVGAINVGNMSFDTGGSRRAQNGSNSSFHNLTAIGGGKGGSWTNDVPASGGSGGGASNNPTSPAGSGTSGQGYPGGNYGGSGNYPTGGGGGAGGAGGNGQNGEPGRPGDGGIGLEINITGTSLYYAGGGGGGDHDEGFTTSGGLGGGGNGSGINGSNGTNGLGGGGGGGGRTGGAASYGGKGGSGVVILRY